MLAIKNNVKGLLVMGKSKLNKEALKAFIQEMVSKEVSKFRGNIDDDLKEEVILKTIEEMEEFHKDYEYKFEEIGDIDYFVNLADVLNEETCPSVDINEEDILYDEEIRNLNDIAKDMKAVDELKTVRCLVNGRDRDLVDGANCNIKSIPILGINLITPPNLKITKVTIDSDMESNDDIEVRMLLVSGENAAMYLLDMGTLLAYGLVSVIESLDEVIEMSSAEFRGITTQTDVYEIETIVLKGGMIEC